MKSLWAYAYQMVSPVTEKSLAVIHTLVELEHSLAREAARTWAGRLVAEDGTTQLLIVTDSPEQNSDANGRLEQELARLGIAFQLTVPLNVGPDGSLPAADA